MLDSPASRSRSSFRSSSSDSSQSCLDSSLNSPSSSDTLTKSRPGLHLELDGVRDRGHSSGSDASLIRMSERASGPNKAGIRILCDEILSLKQRNKRLEESLSRAKEPEPESLPPRRCSIQERRQSLEFEVDDLVAEIRRREQHMKKLRLDRKGETQAERELKRQRDEIKMEFEVLRDEVRKIRIEKDELKRQLRNKDEKIEDLIDMRSTAQSDISPLVQPVFVQPEPQVDVLKQLEEEQDKRELVEVELRKTLQDVDMLRGYVAQVEKEREEERVLQARTSDAVMDKIVNAPLVLADELKISEELGVYEKKVENLECALAQKEELLHGSVAEKDALTVENVHLGDYLEKEKVKMQKKAASLEETAKRCSVVESENRSLRDQLENQKAEHRDSEASLTELESHMFSMVEENLRLNNENMAFRKSPPNRGSRFFRSWGRVCCP